MIERVTSGATRGAALEPEPLLKGGESFAGTITRILGEANQEQLAAAKTAEDLLVHGRGTIHDAMIAAGKADSSFRLLMEMRNRLIEGINQLLETRL